jgi:hypothetical protein
MLRGLAALGNLAHCQDFEFAPAAKVRSPRKYLAEAVEHCLRAVGQVRGMKPQMKDALRTDGFGQSF